MARSTHRFSAALLSLLLAMSAYSQEQRYTTSVIKQNHFVAKLYVPIQNKDSPLVIVLGGSGGGLRSERAQMLAAHGMAALALAYFRHEHLPDSLDNIPVESVLDAIDHLQEMPAINSSKIGIWGASRGSELAFLAASEDQRIHSIVATTPSQVAWHGERSETAWQLAGQAVKSLSFTRDGTDPVLARVNQALTDQKAVNAAQFSFAKMNGPLLMVSAKNDRIWPSFAMAEAIKAHLTAEQYPFSVVHITHPTGHFFSAETWPAINQSIINHFKTTLLD